MVPFEKVCNRWIAGMELRNTTSKRFEFQAQQLGVKDKMGHEGFRKLEWIEGVTCNGPVNRSNLKGKEAQERRFAFHIFSIVFDDVFMWLMCLACLAFLIGTNPQVQGAVPHTIWSLGSSNRARYIIWSPSAFRDASTSSATACARCILPAFELAFCLTMTDFKSWELKAILWYWLNTVQVFSSACWDRLVILMMESIIILRLVY